MQRISDARSLDGRFKEFVLSHQSSLNISVASLMWHINMEYQYVMACDINALSDPIDSVMFNL